MGAFDPTVEAVMTTQELSENEQIAQRQAKLAQWREQEQAFPNDFKRDALAAQLHADYDVQSKEQLQERGLQVAVAGRVMTRRLMGKASFVTIQDGSGQIQLYVARDNLPEGVYAEFKKWDLGDIVAGTGVLFKTKTGELSVQLNSIRLLTKALRPLPDKFHGLQDQEQRFRQRYLDLVVNERSREVFKLRSQLIAEMRNFLNEQQFMEVETPMMHSIAGGATARPFITHHNTLDMELYLRIAPELFLKRLVVGGFERVYEINRNFRNEGISTRHNPEFTMVEFYQAYATYEDLMVMTEQMFAYLADKLLGKTTLDYQGHQIEVGKPFVRLSVHDAILKYEPSISAEQLASLDETKVLCDKFHISYPKAAGRGKLHMLLFEELAEKQLIQPTFVTEFPTEVSPLARANNDNPFITDRFELYVAGQEIANGFSELNDPEDQAARFRAQVEEGKAGDDEAMSYDDDYIRALEHGMPPTAGEGIGIDRLAMLFTDSPSIREVILFPLLRKK
jgi:lysyl-tRNA synthetase class 2